MYSFLREMPLVGSALKIIEILNDILDQLRSALSTLKEAEKKVESDGSVGRAISKALLAIGDGGAITAVIAAINDPDPEPIAKVAPFSLLLVLLAIDAIIDAIDTIVEDKKEKIRLKEEIMELNRRKRNLEDLLDQLKNI